MLNHIEKAHLEFAAARHSQGELEFSNRSWQPIYRYVRADLKGTEEAKTEGTRKRIRESFLDRYNIDLTQTQRERQDLDYGGGLKIKKNSLLLYGVDFIAGVRIKNYFGSFETGFFWTYDSHCIVRFQSEA